MKIKCVHLLSNPESEREQRSIARLCSLPFYGIEGYPVVNPPWTGEIPAGRPRGDAKFELTKGMYGCWKAHRDAITEHLTDCDVLLVCECDCLPVGTMKEFVASIYRAAQACIQFDLDAFTLGYKHGAQILEPFNDIIVVNQWIETHCYLVPFKSRELFLKMFEQPWDQIDYCMTIYLYDHWKKRIGAFADRPAAIQANGQSLTDGSMRNSEQHYQQVRHD